MLHIAKQILQTKVMGISHGGDGVGGYGGDDGDHGGGCPSRTPLRYSVVPRAGDDHGCGCYTHLQ